MSFPRPYPEPLPAPSGPDGQRLQFLREVKACLRLDYDAQRSHTRTPFEENVIRYGCSVGRFDVGEIHHDARSYILDLIGRIRSEGASRVALITGPTGMGKSHLLRALEESELARANGYVVVSKRNDWDLGVLQVACLHGLLEALMEPTNEAPDNETEGVFLDDHLLSQVVDDIAFLALSQILQNRTLIRQYRHQGATTWLGRFWNTHSRFERMVEHRDRRVFKKLNFERFSDYVCEHFLAKKGNAFHRYTLRVLLRYVFPPERELVHHWLRGARVARFHQIEKQIGVSDDTPLGSFRAGEIIRVLASLMSPDLARKLVGEGTDHGKVIVIAFDQTEFQNVRFDETQWKRLLAQVSEFYNGLSNVLVLFTMPQDVKNKLYARMEQQFKDRVDDDPSLTLTNVSTPALLRLYESRMEDWLDRLQPGLVPHYKNLEDPYVPLGQEGVAACARAADDNLRATLAHLSKEFVQYFLDHVTLGPETDYLREFEFCLANMGSSTKNFHDNHLDTLNQLLEWAGAELLDAHGLLLEDFEIVPSPDRIRVVFRDPESKKKVSCYVGCLPYQKYDAAFDKYLEIISNKWKSHHRLWLLRAGSVADVQAKADERENVFVRQESVETEGSFRSLLALKKHTYDREHLLTFLRQELSQSYLGKLIEDACAALQIQVVKQADSQQLQAQRAGSERESAASSGDRA